MKKVIITLFFVVLVMVGGCGNVEKQKQPVEFVFTDCPYQK